MTFTRDTDAVKAALNTVGDYSKTCFEPVLSGISTLMVEQFGVTTPVQVKHHLYKVISLFMHGYKYFLGQQFFLITNTGNWYIHLLPFIKLNVDCTSIFR